MEAFFAWLFAFIAAAAGTVLVYSQKDFTLPGYRGKGGWLMLLTVLGGGILAMYLIGLMAGTGNIFTLLGTQAAFGLSYESTSLKTGTGLLFGSIAFLAAVATFNTYKYGRAVM